MLSSFSNRSLRAGVAAAAAAVAMSCGGWAQAEERELVIDVTGIRNYGIYSDGRNEVFTWNLGANAVITGIDWDVQIEAYAPAVLSQAAVFFGTSDHRQLAINPGFGDDVSGIGNYADRRGDLVGDGLSFSLLADGILEAQFFSQWDYDQLEYESTWTAGSMTLIYEVSPVPEPQSYALMAAGLLVVGQLARRRRHPAPRT